MPAIKSKGNLIVTDLVSSFVAWLGIAVGLLNFRSGQRNCDLKYLDAPSRRMTAQPIPGVGRECREDRSRRVFAFAQGKVSGDGSDWGVRGVVGELPPPESAVAASGFRCLSITPLSFAWWPVPLSVIHQSLSR